MPEPRWRFKLFEALTSTWKPASFSPSSTNGAGKSTLLSAIAGDFRPDGGSILIDEQNIVELPARQRSAFIGRVFQDPKAGTCASLTIEENLALAASRGRRRGLEYALGPAARRKFLAEQLERLGLGLHGRLGSPMGTLSGGRDRRSAS